MLKQSLYVGPDWAMYVGPEGYERAEMLAPGIILGGTGEPLVCNWGSSESLSACLLHPAGVWSSVSASPYAVIYLDPFSTAGRMVQFAADSPSPMSPLLDHLKDYPLAFSSICGATFSAEEAAHFIGEVRAGMSELGIRKAEDHRIRLVAKALSENPVGRLDLKWLAGMVCLSAERLRHLFKQQTGMTLSKYKVWCQLHAMFCHIVSTQGPVYDWRIHEALQFAGFYDDAHGYRTLSQYFGPQSSMAERDLMLINCLGG